MLSKKTIIIPLMASVMLITSCNSYAFKLSRSKFNYEETKEFEKVYCNQTGKTYAYIPFVLEKCKTDKHSLIASKFVLKKNEADYKCLKILSDNIWDERKSEWTCENEYDTYEFDGTSMSNTGLGAAFDIANESDYNDCTLFYKTKELPFFKCVNFKE